MLSLEEGFTVLVGIFAELKRYKPHTEGSEGSRSNASVWSLEVFSGLNHLRTGFYFHILFALYSCKRQQSKGAMGPRPSSSVCVSARRVLSLPVGIGLGRNLWDICCLAHPSGNIYLFIN